MMITPKVAKLLFATRIHPQGWFFGRWGMILTLICLLAQAKIIALCAFVATLFLLAFFRDPERVPCALPEAFVSPADGIVMEIVQNDIPPSELALVNDQETWCKIGIFLAPWHVHINRIPVSGFIEERAYQKGKFSHVATEGTRIENERLSLVINLPSLKTQVICVQVAGFLARRIICDAQKGDVVKAGQRYGLICFGSRVDVYLPSSATVLVREGQRMIGGETILGLFSAEEPAPHES